MMEYVPSVLDGHTPFSFNIRRANDLSDFQGEIKQLVKTVPVIVPVLEGMARSILQAPGLKCIGLKSLTDE